MDVASSTAPPVVAVVVVHEPDASFAEVLRGLAAQDYPNLRTLFLVAGDADGWRARIMAQLPDAVIRVAAGNPGFGAVANGVLKLVEGSGFFCFLHDDVVLDPDAVSRLVEEIYRSNAGLVGPKLVDWDDGRVLQAVGYAVDRFGEVDPIIEPGELDQEQHDAVRDVFALPSACLVVRADLFRTLGGFDPSIEYFGDSLDLCWRVHLSGARVLFVPAARARHRGTLVERRPDLPHRRLSAVHRVRTIATLTGRWRTPVVLLQLLLVSLVEIVVGVFTGRARDGLASLYALGRLVPALPGVVRRRRSIRALREVPDHEVAGLQLRGSARAVSFLRHRQRQQRQKRRPDAEEIRTFDKPDRLPGLVGLALVAVFLFGSRDLISDAVPRLGQFVDLPGPRDAFRAYASNWRTSGFGAASPAPPALAVVGFLGAATLGAIRAARTWLILGPILLGYLGVWRSLAFIPSARSRLGAVLVYAAVPLPYAAVSAGRWAVVLTYGALPWAFSLLRRAGGLTAVSGRGWGDDEIAEAVQRVDTRELVRVMALLSLLTAAVGAFSPTFPVLVVAVAVVLAIGTFAAGGSRTALTAVLAAVVALAVAFVLLQPWSFDLLRSGSWDDIAGPSLSGPRNIGLVELATFQVGKVPAAVLALALYVPVFAGPLVARGWRLTWSARAASLVVAFGTLAVLDDRGSLPVRLPEPGLVLAPVALGLAIAAGSALAGFEHDIRGSRFGWRQPLGLLVSVALVVGLFQAVIGAAGGRWSTRSLALADYLSQLPAAVAANPAGVPAGDYRIVFVGDPRLLPVAGHSVSDGVAYAVAEDGPIQLADQFGVPSSGGDRLTREALQAAAIESTDRVGRLLAPLAVRYVVIPVDDGVRVAGQEPATPGGLVDAFTRQLDLRLVDSPSNLVIFENVAWLPIASVLDQTAAAASREAGSAALASGSVGTGAPAFVGTSLGRMVSGPVGAGSLHLAVPEDGRWTVELDGTEVSTRPAFGWSVAADLPAAGTVTVRRSAGSRAPLLMVQALTTLLVAGLASGRRLRRPSPFAGLPVDAADPLEPVISLETPAELLGDRGLLGDDDFDHGPLAEPIPVAEEIPLTVDDPSAVPDPVAEPDPLDDPFARFEASPSTSPPAERSETDAGGANAAEEDER